MRRSTLSLPLRLCRCRSSLIGVLILTPPARSIPSRTRSLLTRTVSPKTPPLYVRRPTFVRFPNRFCVSLADGGSTSTAWHRGGGNPQSAFQSMTTGMLSDGGSGMSTSMSMNLLGHQMASSTATANSTSTSVSMTTGSGAGEGLDAWSAACKNVSHGESFPVTPAPNPGPAAWNHSHGFISTDNYGYVP